MSIGFMLSWWLAALSLVGMAVNVRNFLAFLMCVELLFLAASLNFVSFSQYFQHLDGQVLVLFVLAIAACESAIALGVLILAHRQFHTVNTETLQRLQG